MCINGLKFLPFYRFQGWPWSLCFPQLEICGNWTVAGKKNFHCLPAFYSCSRTYKLHNYCRWNLVPCLTMYWSLMIPSTPSSWPKKHGASRKMYVIFYALVGNLDKMIYQYLMYFHGIFRRRRQHLKRQRRRERRRYYVFHLICYSYQMLLLFVATLSEKCIIFFPWFADVCI